MIVIKTYFLAYLSDLTATEVAWIQTFVEALKNPTAELSLNGEEQTTLAAIQQGLALLGGTADVLWRLETDATKGERVVVFESKGDHDPSIVCAVVHAFYKRFRGPETTPFELHAVSHEHDGDRTHYTGSVAVVSYASIEATNTQLVARELVDRRAYLVDVGDRPGNVVYREADRAESVARAAVRQAVDAVVPSAIAEVTRFQWAEAKEAYERLRSRHVGLPRIDVRELTMAGDAFDPAADAKRLGKRNLWSVLGLKTPPPDAN